MRPNKIPKTSRTKAPAFLFYAADWLTDPALRIVDASSRGLWIDLLCYMFLSPEPGYLIINGKGLDKEEIRRYSGLDSERFDKVFGDLVNFGIIRIDERGFYYSKRMVEDEKLRELRRESGKLGGNPLLVKKDKEEVKDKVKEKVKRKETPSLSNSNSNSDIIINNNIDIEEVRHPLIEKIKKDFPTVSRLKKPLTDAEADALENEFGPSSVLEVLTSMENYAPLLKKYVSTYLTALAWLKRRKNDATSKNGPKRGDKPTLEDALRGF